MPPFFPGPARRSQRKDDIPRPERLRDVPAYCLKRLHGFFKRLFYIVKLVWGASPAVLIMMALLCLLDGILPVIGAYISSELLNGIAKLISLGYVAEGFAEAFEVFRPLLFIFLLEFLYLFFRKITQQANSVVTNLSGELVANHIKMMIIGKAKTVDQQSFDRPEFYERLENANRESGMRPIGIINATFSVISSVISAVSFIAVLATLGPLAPLVIIAASIPGAIVNYHFRGRNFRYMRFHSKERRELSYYSEVLVNKDYAKEIKILGLGDTFAKKYEGVFKKYFSGIRRLIVREGVAQIIVGTLTVLVNCALFAYVAYHVVFGSGQIGDYSLYTGALTSIATAVGTVISSTARIYEGTLFIDNVMLFMDEEITIRPSLPEAASPARQVPHTLELRDVSFRYPGTERDVIKGVNLTLRSGEETVLVGLNGAGKTTLLKLIMRLYDPTGGVILLDGRDIREYAPEEYYNLFGIIFQDFGRYAQTAAQNIEFGDIKREHLRESVVSASVSGNAHSFIEALPEGYDTPLTRIFEENGIELSGGQWQKISIARAFYKDSDILIMDEPTAALDPLAEQDVFNRFSELSKGKIAIFVSHRLSGAVTASRIVVLENGGVAEMGTHEELMEEHGKYFHLFSTQAKRYTGIDYEEEHTERRRPARPPMRSLPMADMSPSDDTFM